MQYFASFEPFEIFEEFDGVPGTYIKSFLISDVINLNKWQATHETNISNLDSFLGMLGIHYINLYNAQTEVNLIRKEMFKEYEHLTPLLIKSNGNSIV